jgi:hypothetical protein
MAHVILWLVMCAWCLVCWAAPAQASWEAYQQAGEAAYSRGRYTEAERMFLAAVREARHFGPQDPRLDISLNKLALLRVIRGQQAQARRHTQHLARHTARQKWISRHSRQRLQLHSRQRLQLRMARQRVMPGRHIQTQLSRRSGEHRRAATLRTQHFFKETRLSRRPGGYSKGVRISIARPAHRAKRPRAALHRARLIRRPIPFVHHVRRQKSIRQRPSWRAPHLRRGQQWQRPHSTLRRARPLHPGRRGRQGSKRQAARSPRRAMLHVGQPSIAQFWLQQRATA